MAKQIRPKEFQGKKLAKGLEYKGQFPNQGKTKAKFVYAETKKDGLRCVIIDGKPYTASFVRIVNAPMVEKAMKRVPSIAKKYVLDGEIYYKNCDTTKGIVKTMTPGHPLGEKLCFYAFDIFTKKEFMAQKGTVPLKRRKVNLALAITKIRSRCKTDKLRKAIDIFGHAILEPNDKALQKFHRKAVKDGHEGTMIKDPESVYSFRKNKDWLKLKPYRESDLKIVGAELGTKGKANGKRLGKLHLVGKIDGVKVKTKCGGGFTSKQRDEFWAMHKQGKLVGLIVEIEHEGLTKKNAVRFPQFRRIHPEKNR